VTASRELRGRRRECSVLKKAIEEVRAGRSAVLVVHGEQGVGKTALLNYAVDAAPDMRVLRAAGVESEMELAFAALHQMCAPVLDRLARLPAPQRDALGTAFGLHAGPCPAGHLDDPGRDDFPNGRWLLFSHVGVARAKAGGTERPRGATVKPR
jgi:hypothetical protein